MSLQRAHPHFRVRESRSAPAAEASWRSSRARLLAFLFVRFRAATSRPRPGTRSLCDPARRRHLERTGDGREAAADVRRPPFDRAHVESVVSTLICVATRRMSATIFVPLKDWSSARRAAPQVCRRESSSAAWRSPTASRWRSTTPAIPRPWHRRRLRGLRAGSLPIPPRCACSRCCRHSWPSSRQPEAQGINSFFRPTVPQLWSSRSREGAVGSACRFRTSSCAAKHDGTLYLNDFNSSGGPTGCSCRPTRGIVPGPRPSATTPSALGFQARYSAHRGSPPQRGRPEQLERFNASMPPGAWRRKPGVSSGDAIRADRGRGARAARGTRSRGPAAFQKSAPQRFGFRVRFRDREGST